MTNQLGELGGGHSRYTRSTVYPASSVKGRETGAFLTTKEVSHSQVRATSITSLNHESAD